MFSVFVQRFCCLWGKRKNSPCVYSYVFGLMLGYTLAYFVRSLLSSQPTRADAARRRCRRFQHVVVTPAGSESASFHK